MADPAEIAEKLSEAQRRAVLTDDTHFADRWKGHWSCWGNPRTAAALFRLGLIERNDTLSPPTPLGLAVRSYLKDQQQ